MVKTTSDFAILDIKRGRRAVHKIVAGHQKKIPVTIKGYIVGDWSGDDDTSIEYQIEVISHKLGKPVKRKCSCVRCYFLREEAKRNAAH